MPYRIAADLVVLVHFLWIVFLTCGVFIGRRTRWVRNLHIAGLLAALVIQLKGWYCPLTYLEIWLRRMHDPAVAYSGSFIIHYLERLVYLDVRLETVLILTLVLVIFSVAVYARRPRHMRGNG